MIQEQIIIGQRFWLFWVLAFAAFPIGGLFASLWVGPITNPIKASLAGILAGAVIGFIQWLVLRSAFQLPIWWVVATSIGLSVGLAVSTAALGTETLGNALLFRAAITGFCIGLAQWLVLRQILPQSFIWIIVMTLSWAIGWFVTRSAGIDLSPKWTVFGTTGALAFQFVTGLTIYFLTRIPIN